MTLTLATLVTAPTRAADAAYRAAASIVSLATLALVLGAWPSPLAALAALPLPGDLLPLLAWAPEAATWTTAHSDATAGVGFGLLLVGLTAAAHEPVDALPADSRAGSTAALGLAALAQVDQLPQAGFTLAVFAAVALVIRGPNTSDLVGAALVHLLGAVFAVPLALVNFAVGGRADTTAGDNQ